LKQNSSSSTRTATITTTTIINQFLFKLARSTRIFLSTSICPTYGPPLVHHSTSRTFHHTHTHTSGDFLMISTVLLMRRRFLRYYWVSSLHLPSPITTTININTSTRQSIQSRFCFAIYLRLVCLCPPLSPRSYHFFLCTMFFLPHLLRTDDLSSSLREKLYYLGFMVFFCCRLQ